EEARVEGERGQRDLASGCAPGEREEAQRADGEDSRDEPCPALVAAGVARREDAHLEHCEGNRSDSHLRDPLLRLAEARGHAARSASAARAHGACSRRSGSSWAAYASAAAACSGPPAFPSATSAFRRR